MVEPASFPAIDPAQARLSNAACGRRLSLNKRLGDGQFGFRVVPFSPPFTPTLALMVQVGASEVVLLAESTLLEWAAYDCPHPDQLPKALQLACLEDAFGDAREQLARLLQTTIKLRTIDAWVGEPPATPGLTLQVRGPGGAGYARLLVPPDRLDWLCHELQQAPLRPTFDWRQLPVPLEFLVATARLPPQELAALEVNDIVLFDPQWVKTEDSLLLRVPGGLEFEASYTARQVTIMSEGRPNGWSEDFDEPLAQGLEVSLAFLLKEQRIPLGDVVQFEPGYVIELGLNRSAPVMLKVNGVAVAQCELVEIENRLGARIVTMGSATAPKADARTAESSASRSSLAAQTGSPDRTAAVTNGVGQEGFRHEPAPQAFAINPEDDVRAEALDDVAEDDGDEDDDVFDEDDGYDSDEDDDYDPGEDDDYDPDEDDDYDPDEDDDYDPDEDDDYDPDEENDGPDTNRAESLRR